MELVSEEALISLGSRFILLNVSPPPGRFLSSFGILNNISDQIVTLDSSLSPSIATFRAKLRSRSHFTFMVMDGKCTELYNLLLYSFVKNSLSSDYSEKENERRKGREYTDMSQGQNLGSFVERECKEKHHKTRFPL